MSDLDQPRVLSRQLNQRSVVLEGVVVLNSQVYWTVEYCIKSEKLVALVDLIDRSTPPRAIVDPG